LGFFIRQLKPKSSQKGGTKKAKGLKGKTRMPKEELANESGARTTNRRGNYM